MSVRTLALVAPLLLTALGAAPAHAQQTPQAQPQAAASDIVRLKNGSVYRGTVAEYVPGKHVEIVLVSGKTKRFQLTEVAYAGPVATDPVTARPGGESQPPGQGPVTVDAPLVKLRLTSTKPGVEFHRKTGVARAYASDIRGGVRADAYSLMCVAPCDLTMPAGTHSLALTRDGTPVPAEPVSITGDGALSADYTSYRAVRIMGTLMIVTSLVTGIYLGATAIHPSCDSDEDCDQVETGRMVAGVGIFIGGTIIGSIIADIDDSAEITFTPSGPRGGDWGPAGAPVGADRGTTSGLSGGEPAPFGGWTPGLTASYRF